MIKKIVCVMIAAVFALTMMPQAAVFADIAPAESEEAEAVPCGEEDTEAAALEEAEPAEETAEKSDAATEPEEVTFDAAPEVAGNDTAAPAEDNDISVNSAADEPYDKNANSWRFKNGLPIESEEEAEDITTQSISNYPGAIRKGIDVSHWNGTIDWKKAKADGVQFAIINCGYGGNYTSQDDAKFAYNVKECEKYGIPYGVYLYSHAETDAEAKAEAQHALRVMKACNCSPEYPVYYDLEDKDVLRAGKARMATMTRTFCETIERSGYNAGVYASLNWWNTYLTDALFDDYDKWVAQWNNKCLYAGEYSLWQQSATGRVNGISGNVDINYEFPSYRETVEIGGGNTVKLRSSTHIYGAAAKFDSGQDGYNYSEIPDITGKYKLASNCRPANFRLSAIANNKGVQVSWGKVSGNVDGFMILRKTDGAKYWREVTKKTASATYYNDTTARAANTKYAYLLVSYKKVTANGRTEYKISPHSMSVVGVTSNSVKKNAYGKYAPKINYTKRTVKNGSNFTLKLTYNKACLSTWTRWRSHDTSVVKVYTSTGKVRAVGKGTALVSGRTPDGRDIRCTVTVK